MEKNKSQIANKCGRKMLSKKKRPGSRENPVSIHNLLTILKYCTICKKMPTYVLPWGWKWQELSLLGLCAHLHV